jgi:hypothetical protein
MTTSPEPGDVFEGDTSEVNTIEHGVIQHTGDEPYVSPAMRAALAGEPVTFEITSGDEPEDAPEGQ